MSSDAWLVSPASTCSLTRCAVLVALPGLGSSALGFPQAVFSRLTAIGVTCYAASYGTAVDSIEDMAKAVFRGIDAFVPPDAPLVIMGYSMGGFVAQAMMNIDPSRIAGVVLVATTCAEAGMFPITDPVFARAALALASGDLCGAAVTDPRETMEALFPPSFFGSHTDVYLNVELPAAMEAARITPEQTCAQMFAILEWTQTKACSGLQQWACPVLIVQGTADTVIDPSSAKLLAANLKHPTVEMLTGVGHGIPLQVPQQLSHLVASWMYGKLKPRGTNELLAMFG